MFSIYLIIILVVLYTWKKTRRFAISFLPWFLFGIIYDSMRLYPTRQRRHSSASWRGAHKSWLP